MRPERFDILPFPSSAPQRRARAIGLLLTFALALLAGAFLHPLGDLAHECGVSQGHLDAPHDHQHDDRACAFCHLAHDLGQALAACGPTELPALALRDAVAPATQTRVERRPTLGFCSRGPPRIG